METTKPVIFLYPISKPLQELMVELQEKSEELGLDIYEIDDPKELFQVVPSVGQTLIITSSPKKCANIISEGRKLFKKLNTKIILLSPKALKKKTVDKLMKFGLTEVITEPVPQKTLAYKINLMIRSLKLIEIADDPSIKSLSESPKKININDLTAQDSSEKTNEKSEDDEDTLLSELSNLTSSTQAQSKKEEDLLKSLTEESAVQNGSLGSLAFDLQEEEKKNQSQEKNTTDKLMDSLLSDEPEERKNAPLGPDSYSDMMGKTQGGADRINDKTHRMKNDSENMSDLSGKSNYQEEDKGGNLANESHYKEKALNDFSGESNFQEEDKGGNLANESNFKENAQNDLYGKNNFQEEDKGGNLANESNFKENAQNDLSGKNSYQEESSGALRGKSTQSNQTEETPYWEEEKKKKEEANKKAQLDETESFYGENSNEKDRSKNKDIDLESFYEKDEKQNSDEMDYSYENSDNSLDNEKKKRSYLESTHREKLEKQKEGMLEGRLLDPSSKEEYLEHSDDSSNQKESNIENPQTESAPKKEGLIENNSQNVTNESFLENENIEKNQLASLIEAEKRDNNSLESFFEKSDDINSLPIQEKDFEGLFQLDPTENQSSRKSTSENSIDYQTIRKAFLTSTRVNPHDSTQSIDNDTSEEVSQVVKGLSLLIETRRWFDNKEKVVETFLEHIAGLIYKELNGVAYFYQKNDDEYVDIFNGSKVLFQDNEKYYMYNHWLKLNEENKEKWSKSTHAFWKDKNFEGNSNYFFYPYFDGVSLLGYAVIEFNSGFDQDFKTSLDTMLSMAKYFYIGDVYSIDITPSKNNNFVKKLFSRKVK